MPRSQVRRGTPHRRLMPIKLAGVSPNSALVPAVTSSAGGDEPPSESSDDTQPSDDQEDETTPEEGDFFSPFGTFTHANPPGWTSHHQPRLSKVQPVVVTDPLDALIPEIGGFNLGDVGHAIGQAASAVAGTISSAASSAVADVDGAIRDIEQIPGIGPALKTATDEVSSVVNTVPGLSLLPAMAHLGKDLVTGHLSDVQRDLVGVGRNVAGLVSFVPGIGTGLAIAINDGLSLLEGDDPFEMALETLFSVEPLNTLPEAVTNILRQTGNILIKYAEHPDRPIADLIITQLRDDLTNAVPDPFKGMAGTFFDAAIHLLIHVVPVSTPSVTVLGKAAPILMQGNLGLAMQNVLQQQMAIAKAQVFKAHADQLRKNMLARRANPRPRHLLKAIKLSAQARSPSSKLVHPPITLAALASRQQVADTTDAIVQGAADPMALISLIQQLNPAGE